MPSLKIYFLTATVMLCAFAPSSFSQNTSGYKKIKGVDYPLTHRDEVNSFYQSNGNKLFWFNAGEQFHLLRIELLNILDSAKYMGLDKNNYRVAELKDNIHESFLDKDSLEAMQTDRLLSDAAISYSKDVYQGYKIGNWVGYDELSKKANEDDNTFLITRLISVTTAPELTGYVHSLEPSDKEYGAIKIELQNQTKDQNTFKKMQLATSLNLYRWIHHFHFDKYIVVNIGSATLRYYENDSLMLRMKAVVGKPSTKTPRFAAHCNQVILYPYWNVPESIALNELLPQFKRNPSDIDYLNMQILDAKGNVVNHRKLNWRGYSASYFPFHIRQSTGCDNSLGVVKFNLTSPYAVYLHDTNIKTAFMSGWRYYSHGCIRIEEPIKLANALLQDKIDSTFLASCLKDQKPVPLNLDKPVPVFVVYVTAETDARNRVIFYKDIYSLLNKN
jgi:murein L,D-transpeptidase YcbB/YkuD